MNTPLLWFIAGIILCLMELFLPTAFVEATLGVSALGVALVALVVPNFGLQVAIWMGFSAFLVWALRRWMPKGVPYILAASTEAETLGEIPAGATGRVLYEGSSWQARCEDDSLAIAPHQRVIVVGRRGNTLLVMPESALEGK